MRAGHASRTAVWVAFLRALGDSGLTSVQGFKDPTARVLLDAKWQRRLERTPLATGTLGAATRAGVDLLALRTRVIDEAVDRELARGTRQVVILGAGLDGRAWRMPRLEHAHVFEVDHPSTQRYKRTRLAELKPAAGRIDFVAVDFERDVLDGRLAQAGHDPKAPTVWIWEGVVMYLTPEAFRTTLRGVAARSAAGSTLIVNYHTGKRGGLLGLILRLLGEPNRSAFWPDEMRRELAAASFTVEDDSGVSDWQARLGGCGLEYGASKVTRVAVARLS